VTLFEYLAAGYILMLSFAVLRAMTGVPHAVRSRKRSWVHICWLSAALVMCLVAFWAFWPYRQVEWTLFTFVNALSIPALLYAHTSVLVPPDPAAVPSWEDYFNASRVPIFATGVAFMAAVAVSNQSALGVSPLHSSQILNYSLLSMYAVGLLFQNQTVHRTLALIFPCWLVMSVAVLGRQPDSIFSFTW